MTVEVAFTQMKRACVLVILSRGAVSVCLPVCMWVEDGDGTVVVVAVFWVLPTDTTCLGIIMQHLCCACCVCIRRVFCVCACLEDSVHFPILSISLVVTRAARNSVHEHCWLVLPGR